MNKIKHIKLTKPTDSEKRRADQVISGRIEPVRNIIPDGKIWDFRGEKINLPPDYQSVDHE